MNRMKKLLIAAALLCGIGTTALADNEVNVLYLDGTTHVVKMSDIDRIELSKENIKVLTTDGASETHELSMIDKIELRSVANAVEQIKGRKGGDILVKADGYGFEVSGLADGDEVSVYTQGGVLMGKVRGKDGSAHVDASSYANGIYIIKAGGRSLKMVKK